MGKAARNKKNRNHKKLKNAIPPFVRVPRDPGPVGTFVETDSPTRPHMKNEFFVHGFSGAAEMWHPLGGIGAVKDDADAGHRMILMLAHPLMQTYRTGTGLNMAQYLERRVDEGSLDDEFLPALTLLEFASRAMINAYYSAHRQMGMLGLEAFDQIWMAVLGRLAPLFEIFPELNFNEIGVVAVMKARLTAEEIFGPDVLSRLPVEQAAA